MQCQSERHNASLRERTKRFPGMLQHVLRRRRSQIAFTDTDPHVWAASQMPIPSMREGNSNW